MHLFDQRVLGIMMLVLLGVLVFIKQRSTGSVLDRPRGNFRVQLVNSFNLLFLLMMKPLAAILLITRHPEIIDPTRKTLAEPWCWMVPEIAGLILYVIGNLLMVWALITLGRNYQLGGRAPRSEDRMIMDGPYRVVRHPMYTSALSIALGLACLTESLAYLAAFVIYLTLILVLIPIEEEGLERAYHGQYAAYQRKVRKLVPFLI